MLIFSRSGSDASNTDAAVAAEEDLNADVNADNKQINDDLEQPPETPNQNNPKVYTTRSLKFSPEVTAFRDSAFEKMLSQIDLRAAALAPREELQHEVEQFLSVFAEESSVQISYREQQQIAEDVVNDMVGLGPLEPLLADPTITDILVNSPTSIYVECGGKLSKTDIKFRGEKHVLQVAQRIANQVGRRVDEASPMVDARLQDGSRVNVIIPPIALEGVSISIRRFSKKGITLEKMCEQANLSENMLKLLAISSTSRLNILVSGGTGAGKTTLLNALSHLIDPSERIVTIEDSAELQLQQPHVVRLESRPPNIEGSGQIAIRDLVRNALRMRPDRIIVGECRGAETFDMLQAMNTGHDGSMSTLHANSCQEALHRLENLVLMAGFELPNAVIKNYIADALDLIVHVARMRDGVRRVTQIAEVIDYKDGEIRSQDLFKFKYMGEDKEGNIKGKFDCVNSKTHIANKVAYFGLETDLKKALNKKEKT